METLGLYLSIPFCRSKCTYCNFASGVYPESYHEKYIERVIEDLLETTAWARARGAVLPEIVDSVYLGGGTPSILSPQLLRKLFAALRREFVVLPSAEITLEAAPGQIEEAFFPAMVECGVNRLSFGVQTFIDREAAVSGRLHTREMALGDIARARKAGISSINLDLIAGLAHQTPASWQESLDVLLATEVPHASVYMLEVDEDSRLGKELILHGSRYHAGAVPGDDSIADMYMAAIDRLSAAGIMQYEISNFAESGAPSRHNRKYWERKPYLGFGIDASSMLRTSDAEVLRFTTTEDLDRYLTGGIQPEAQRVGRDQQLEEAWFLGLRLMEGVSPQLLEAEFGVETVQSKLAVAENLREEGLLQNPTGRWSLTSRGKLLSNEVFERFLGSTEEDSLPTPALIS